MNGYASNSIKLRINTKRKPGNIGVDLMTLISSAAGAAVCVSAEQAYEIAVEAYLYFYPLLVMHTTMRQMTNMASGEKPGFGPANSFAHMRAYPDAHFRAVVRPNFDTLYSSAWLDLRQEPVVLSVPDSGGRYFLLPMLDMWTDVFASPGWRTSGTRAQSFAIVPSGWSGTIPAGVHRIESPTDCAWIIGRIKTDGPSDYANVHRFQDALQICLLSQFGQPSTVASSPVDPSIDMITSPGETVNQMSVDTYFMTAAELLKRYKPHSTDYAMLHRLERIGLMPGASYNVNELNVEIKDSLARGAKDALKLMNEKVHWLGRPINGWSMNTESMGVYGNYYLKRAIVAMVGLGANQPEDAIYPLNCTDADGAPLQGANNYVLHFEKDQLPPANAFWSITMYDADGFQTENSLNRFAISSWMPLKYNSDGSLDIFVQHHDPGADRTTNWLPSPASGVLGITMRLYAPALRALNGDWAPPPVRRV